MPALGLAVLQPSSNAHAVLSTCGFCAYETNNNVAVLG